MARYDHLPIWKTAMDLAVLLERAVRGFPRYRKYALGADLRRQAQRICTLIVRTNEARAERERVLEQLVCAVEEMKTLIQLGNAIQAFASFSEFVQAAEHAVSLGRQSGGYLKSGCKRRELIYTWAPPGVFPPFHPTAR